ncbi:MULTISPECIES: lipoate--protein ligase family protein [unclassified Sporosarcina]|uniref:lipoate--protein ligase family protein n=1 Tax=unclassified Sporosarcina TaxID=2647733 RepID=UPI00203F3D17|nr:MULTISPECIES: lipoate--protein ligase family protein [unclassified Sporosarcina]GKV66857.1 octanoyl-[GcvH]:protein N-octanoyltransferase [Sporosarcina sp. NCCP-2331]GLB57266.1 octanoyl-[GcvH]:protein N-octanoyltransferase [Sporosarcina sp. NCCP-2378]
MSQHKNLLNQPSWRFIDESITARNRSALESFAMDDALCQLVGQQKSVSVVRTWVHDKTIVLGIQDHRMPFIQQAIELIEQRGFQSIVRNSGGLAVVLDEGVLNISLIFSEQKSSIDIPVGYDAMLAFVRLLFPELGERIEAYEIAGSYCPGSYDLSVDGKKFAGISQRRLRSGVAVQVYLCVEGSGSERAAFIRDVYETGLQGAEMKFAYPEIRPEVMASLSEILNTQLTVNEVVIRLQLLLRSLTEDIRHGGLTDEELDLYGFYLQRVFDRNQKMLS